MAGVPGITIGRHVGLPGQLPPLLSEDDDDLEHEGHSPKRIKGNKQPGSSSTGGGETITMDSLRALLVEQSTGLLAAQKAQLASSLAEFETRQTARMQVIEEKVEKQSDQYQDLVAQFREMGDRVRALESKGPAMGGEPDRRATLVFGGWQPQTRRAVIVSQLGQAIHALGLNDAMDQQPFTTGPRRSVSLANFEKRAGEDVGDVRKRMLRVLQVINAAKVELEGGARVLWCSFSRSPAERGRAAVAAVVKKALMRHAPGRLPDLDVEYSTGNSWIKDDQLTGMGKPPPECHRARVLETKAGEAWLDESTSSKWLEVDRAVVSAIVTEHKF